MDAQQPNVPEVPAAPGMPQTPETPRDSHGITIAAMAVFVLLSLAAVAFLYYQNQQLKGMIAGYQNNQATPTPTAAADPTANWKTYNDPAGKFAFKYPLDWLKPKDMGILGDPTQSFIFDVREVSTKLALTAYMASQCSASGTNLCSDPAAGPIAGSIQYNHPTSHYDSLDTLTKQGGIIFVISLTSRNPNQSADENTKQTYSQIVSTFKFLLPTASPSAKPIACTLEAKICPDGSSVGRTGPNCEFAPCPTP